MENKCPVCGAHGEHSRCKCIDHHCQEKDKKITKVYLFKRYVDDFIGTDGLPKFAGMEMPSVDAYVSREGFVYDKENDEYICEGEYSLSKEGAIIRAKELVKNLADEHLFLHFQYKVFREFLEGKVNAESR